MTPREQQLHDLFPEASAIPEEVRLPLPIEPRTYLVGGELREWDGPSQEVRSAVCLRAGDSLEPAVLGSTPRLTAEAALEALRAAGAAYGNGEGRWPTMSVRDRIGHVERFVAGLQSKRDEIVRLLMWEIGKSAEDSAKEFDRTVQYVVDTIEALKDLDRVSSRFSIEQGVIGQIRRAPLGVVLCLGPHNYPLNETFTTLIPALIMGNSVVYKPPRHGALLHWPLLPLFAEVFPPGVVNTVCGAGREILGPLMQTGEVNVLALIGASRSADLLRQQHPKPHRLRCVLGLEAKNPAIILADADLDAALSECLLGALSFNGQRCTALKVLFVHRSVADAFVARFAAAVNALPIGMPWQPKVAVTPLPDPERVQAMTEYVADARERGGEVVNEGGGAAAGTLFAPAVVYPAGEAMRLYSEEQFGPVVPIIPFDDLETPIRYVTQSDTGQQVSLFGRDPAALARLIDPLVNQVCRVNLNSQCQRGPDTFPFTGRKDSAEGTLSVSDALRVFTIRTLVAAKQTELNKGILTTITREHQSNFLSTDFIL